MSAASTQHDVWLRRFVPASPGAVRLVALPHAGGTAPYFAPLARKLAPRLDVVCVQYPGRQERHRETPVDDLHALADQLFEVLSGQPPQPTVLFGHSMGAALGYEVARRTEAQGGELLGIIVSGRRAAHLHREESVHLLDDDGLIAEIHALSGTDPGVLADKDLLSLVLPSLRADYRAAETYRHRQGERLRLPISVLTGESDPRVTLDDARAWAELTSGAFRFRSFPGGHFYLNDQQSAVASAIMESVASFGPDDTSTTP